MASSSVGMSYTLAGLAVTVAIGGSVARAQPMAQPDPPGPVTATPPAPPVVAPDDVATLPDVVAEPEHITSGVEALLRIDGKGRGFAGGFGIAFAATDSIELELAALRSDIWGAYAGVRYRFLTGWLRPYAAVGIPMFFFTDDAGASTAAFGVRGAAGLELMLSSHYSVEADLGVEHFLNVSDTLFMGQALEATVFVPTLALIGRI